MSILGCLDCGARYAVGLSQCPQCASVRYTDDPDSAPKSTPVLVGEPGPELVPLPPGDPDIPADDGDD